MIFSIARRRANGCADSTANRLEVIGCSGWSTMSPANPLPARFSRPGRSACLAESAVDPVSRRFWSSPSCHHADLDRYRRIAILSPSPCWGVATRPQRSPLNTGPGRVERQHGRVLREKRPFPLTRGPASSLAAQGKTARPVVPSRNAGQSVVARHSTPCEPSSRARRVSRRLVGCLAAHPAMADGRRNGRHALAS